MSYFKEDSPYFRMNLVEMEETVAEMSGIFREWCEKAGIAHAKGEEYCNSLKSLYSSIDDHSQKGSLSTYKPFLQEISEVLSTVLACNEGIVYSLQEVFTMYHPNSEFANFLTNSATEMAAYKKPYDRLQKELEALKTQTISFKRNYVFY